MQKQSSWLYIILIILCFINTNSNAAETKNEEIDKLLGLDIEELVVYSASKREESIDSAPGVINVINHDEIEKSGAKNLMDALELLPDIVLTGIPTQRNLGVSLRGVGGYATPRILLLMNGRPLREGYVGGLDKLVYESFPLEIIDRVELIRGPGSVLYGTNAFAGLINIITKSPEQTSQGATSLSYGSFDTTKAEFSHGSKKNDYNYYVAGEVSHSQGYKGDMYDSANNFIEDDYLQGFHDVAATFNYKNFKVNAFSGFMEEDTTDFPHTGHFTPSTYRQHFIDAGYTQKVNENWDLNYNGSYSLYDYFYGKIPSPATQIQAETEDFLGEVSLTGKINDKLNAVIGTSYQRLTGEEAVVGTRWDLYRLNGYTQLDYQALDWLHLIGGAQINKVENSRYKVSSRLAVITNFAKYWGTKLMYGQAFRSPYPIETSFNNGTFTGLPSLEPEIIDTFDAQVFYRNNKTYASVSTFYSIIDDIIRFGSVGYTNAGKAYVRGITFEVEEKLTEKLKVRASASYQTNKLDNGAENFDSTPNLLLKISANYQVNKWLNWDVSNMYVGQNNETNPDPVNYLNPESDGYNLLNTNLIFDLYALTGKSLTKGTSFSIQGYNLLDDDTFASGLSFFDTNTGPIRAGRSVYAKLKVKF